MKPTVNRKDLIHLQMIKEDITVNPYIPQLWYSAFFAKWIVLVSSRGSKIQSGLNIAGKTLWVSSSFWV